MKNIFVVALISLISSCAFVLPPAGPGLIYTKATELVYYDPYIKPQQRVVLCSKNILGLFSTGDNSFDAVRLNSQIRKISTIERTYQSKFVIYGESCLIVKGE